jgi:hypothetical protein
LAEGRGAASPYLQTPHPPAHGCTHPPSAETLI